MTVVYVDLLLMLNFIANYLLLLAAARMAGIRLRRGRYALAALLGAGYAAAVFLPGAGWLGGWFCRVAVGTGMCLTAYGKEKRILRPTVMFFGASAALAGAVLALESLGGVSLTLERGFFYSSLDIRLLLVVFVACYFVLSLFFRRIGMRIPGRKVYLRIQLCGKEIPITAIVDTGHTLTDPATNRPVVVVSWDQAADVLPDWVDPNDPIGSLQEGHRLGTHIIARLIPYRCVGVDCGMLLALRADAVSADGMKLGKLLVALSPTPVDDGTGCHALIGGI